MPGRKNYKVIVKDVGLNVVNVFNKAEDAGKYYGLSTNTVLDIMKCKRFNKRLQLWFINGGKVCGDTLSKKESEDFVLSYNDIANRVCLRCDKLFESSSKSNRICTDCRYSNDRYGYIDRERKIVINRNRRNITL